MWQIASKSRFFRGGHFDWECYESAVSLRIFIVLLFSAPIAIAACSGTSNENGLADGGSSGASSGGRSSSSGYYFDGGMVFQRDGQVVYDADLRSSSSSGMPDPGVPRILYLGRRDLRDPSGPKFSFPSGRVIARFQGTTASINVSHTSGYAGDVDCLWDVLIDGAVSTSVAFRAGMSTKVLASDLTNTTHTVEMYRRVESTYGTTQILGMTFGDGTLLPPTNVPTRRVEFIADSQFEGYGIEAASPTDALCQPTPRPASHNARKSAMELVAKSFNAELMAVAYSGKGLGRNAAGANDTVYWASIYGRSLGDDGTSSWNFSIAPSDAVVITVGGQDFDPDVNSNSVTTEEPAFAPRYANLVQMVRTANPNAHIFLTIGPQLKESYPSGLRSTLRRVFGNVVTTRAGVADNKVYVLEIAESIGSEETACYQHGGPGLHGKMATAINSAISLRLGW